MWDEGDLIADFEGISDVEMEEGQDDKFPNLQQSEEPLPDILEKLSGIINLDSISKFNVSHSHLWEGAVRGLNRKSFSPCNKISVKFCDDVGTSEGAVDAGGPKREFFTLVLNWSMNSQLFSGSNHCKYLSCNASSQANDDYFNAGQIIAMSLVHGGPGFPCLSPSLYQCIIKGSNNISVSVSDVYDAELRSSLEKLLNTQINISPLSTLMGLAGTFKFISSLDDILTLVQQTVKWFSLDRSHFSQEQFVKGLSVLGVYGSMLKNPDSFHSAFCFSPQQLNAELISQLFETKLSDVGSNHHRCESLILSYWNDYLLDVEESAGAGVTFNDIVFFASGCNAILPFGIKLFLEFLHQPEKMAGCQITQKPTHVHVFFIFPSPIAHTINSKRTFLLHF